MNKRVVTTGRGDAVRRSPVRRPYDPSERNSEFARGMREAYERLRADPVAWADWMEECASIDLLLVSQEYWEERERRRLRAREAQGSSS